MRKRCTPALFLFFTGSYTAEILSGATPPIAVLVNPLALVYLWALYGSGALLIREVTLRWHKGWPTILMLGVAYALLEEGLTTKVIFDPTKTDLSPLVNYGRVAGINVAFTVQLVIYHAVVSIAIPIMLAHLVYPERKHELWVSKWKLVALSFLLFSTVALGAVAVFPYETPPHLYLGALLITALLVGVARLLPAQFPMFEGKPRAPRTLAIIGFSATFLFFFASFGFPGMNVPPLLTMLTMVGVTLIASRAILKGSGKGAVQSATEQYGLASGVLGFFVFFAVFQEALGNTGMIFVGFGTIIFLYWLWRRVKRTSL